MSDIVMTCNGVRIEDTFAEAFPMTACQVLVTAESRHWVDAAVRSATGYGCSVIGCDAEAGIERFLSPAETPDNRPGASLLFFGFKRENLEKAVVNRVGQCIMTCPTTACYSGLPKNERAINVGGQLRYFGDGYQISKFVGDRRFWRIPVMDGEFLCEETFGTTKGVAGGNFLILGRSPAEALSGAEAAAAAIAQAPGVISPFPGGVVRSGSKVGSKYKNLKASTNDAYCPTLRANVATKLPPDAEAVYEIVIDGLSEADVARAMNRGIRAACQPGVIAISAGNYGGTLGPVHLYLKSVLATENQ